MSYQFIISTDQMATFLWTDIHLFLKKWKDSNHIWMTAVSTEKFQLLSFLIFSKTVTQMHCSMHLDTAELAWYKHTTTSNTTIKWAVNASGQYVSADTYHSHVLPQFIYLRHKIHLETFPYYLTALTYNHKS